MGAKAIRNFTAPGDFVIIANREGEITEMSALDNFKPNSKQIFGPAGNDYLHILTASAVLKMFFGFRLNSIWRFRSTSRSNLFVPNLGGAISGANGIFGTDLNGDGGTGGGNSASG